MSITDEVEGYLARRAMWDRLRGSFRQRPLTTDQHETVQTVAKVAFDRVWPERKLHPAALDEEYARAIDYCEAAALYGFAAGYEAAHRDARE